ncbi:MAG: glucodextranase DOMON-like domain-containing protein, partial [Halapricum sp.]
MKRREYLTGLAGLGALSATGQVGAEAGTQRLSLTTAVGDDTYAPGAPRFAPLGVTFYDRLKTDFDTDHAGGKDRDNFAPHIVGDPKRDPDNYSADDFSWSIKSAPDGSSATIEYAPADGDMEQYDSGKHNVAEFAPDVPGRYVLELTAPDGKYEQILHIFPKDGNQGGPPRIDIEGHYDSDTDEFVLDSNPKLAPNSPMTDSDLFVAWLADNRDTLATDDITVGDGTNSWTARIPKSALGGETGRVHAAPSDTNASGYSETVVLDPTNETIEYPNRPPEWLQNGIMYEIFPRSFMGPPKSGEWPLYNSNANFKAFESKLDYLNELNVDVIWFTPVVPSESGNWKRQNWKQYPDRFKYVGGGPHGYDALSYFDIAEDLTSKYQYPDYKDALWPYEDGYNPDDNMRVKARESAMTEFQDFLDAAHERDIKVCLDFVINHGGRHHRFFQDTIDSLSDFRPQGWSYPGVAKNNENSKYFDWFARKKGPNTTNDGKVVDAAPAATGFAGLRVEPQWNYGNVALREHILAAAKNWASMGVDAFRCDIAYGVPHSFWKEVRNTVRAENSEFMMLDETIPNDPNFAEDEFDLHFDTSGYLTTNHQVVNGGDPMKLYDVIASRDNEGWPEYTLITNNAEDHDEQRLYKIARDGSREDPAKAQRACWAAGVTLPGVPFIYYGQERLITEYGHSRFNYDGKGNDPRSGDVGPNKFKRAFMNWEENGDTVPQEHLQFYKDVTTFYKETDILKPGADLKKTWFRSDDDVLVFGRSMETDNGTENAIVMIHFDPGTATVDLLPGASTTDMYTDSDIGVDSEGKAVSVEFDTLAVVEADSLFSVGEQIAKLSEEKGDDNGPGSYTYPTGDAYSDGVFDITEMTIHTTADSVQFRAAIAGDVSNTNDLPHGITAQHLQVYLHNPSAKDGATEGRTGTNVTFEKPYQYRLVADGENGARVEDHKGEKVADGSLMVNPVANEIIAEMPKSSLDGGIRSHYVAPLMLGYDGDADGNVMAVKSKAGAKAFGGADNPGMAPRVIDMVVPETSSQSDALSYSADAKATLPYTSLASEFTQIGKAKDATGDDNGPGNYQYPASPDKEMYDGMWDIKTVNVYESRSRIRFEYQLATEIENVWGLDGMSQQFPQVYIRDPDAG